MKRLKHLKDTLMCCVESQMSHLDTVNAHELGAAIDMIKDLEEAMYYCTITKAMKEQDEMMMHHKMKNGNGNGNGHSYFSDPYYLNGYPMMDDYDEYKTRISGEPYEYENGNGNGKNGYKNGNGKEGRSGRSRRAYMEAKELHHDEATKMRELEKYMQELSSDVLEMIEEASPEERQFLGKKIATLATKVDALG